ncbi:hypothetical protein MTR_5g084150 [Medicago truncatula]|uniref:Uncharacterized protein n=1 Tax=Medicago truncatula TaxID=3880 RepID=G7KH47_MEDTR|nr:hypothetical protein MTR_5g084150 [Medicago truncatula]
MGLHFKNTKWVISLHGGSVNFWAELDLNQRRHIANEFTYPTPRGSRIPVASLKERCPKPLDDGDEFLRLNRVSFDKTEVQCGGFVEKVNEHEKKFVEIKTECHAIVVEENPQVRSVGLYLKSHSMGLRETIQVQRDTYSSLWWESSNDKGLAVRAWKHLLICMKFMEFLPNNRKKKDDAFFMSYMPP